MSRNIPVKSLKKFRDLNKTLRNFVKFDFRKNRHKTRNIRILIVFFLGEISMYLYGRNLSKKKLKQKKKLLRSFV